MEMVRGVAPCGSRARRAGSFFSALGWATALLVITLPVIAADVALPLPNVDIPPITGKTGSFDIIDIDQAAHLMYVGDRITQGVDIFDISTPSARYLQTVPPGPANGLAINPATNQALLGCSNKEQPMAALWDLKAHGVITTFSQAGAGDMAFYYPKEDLYLFAASNFPPGAVLAIFGGSPVHWIANIPTAAGSHALGFDETNHVIYAI